MAVKELVGRWGFEPETPTVSTPSLLKSHSVIILGVINIDQGLEKSRVRGIADHRSRIAHPIGRIVWLNRNAQASPDWLDHFPANPQLRLAFLWRSKKGGNIFS
jgi:hypothetical protein